MLRAGLRRGGADGWEATTAQHQGWGLGMKRKREQQTFPKLHARGLLLATLQAQKLCESPGVSGRFKCPWESSAKNVQTLFLHLTT